MKNTLRLCLALVLIISSLFVFGIMAMAETDTVTVVNTGNLGTKIDYDTETKTMTFTYVGDTSGWYELMPAVATTSDGTNMVYVYDTDVQSFIDQYRDEVEHVEMGFFKKIQLIDMYKNGTGELVGCAKLFQGMTSLKSIHFAANQRITIGQGAALESGGVFADCPLLTTVWFGDDANKIEGCVNFTGSDTVNDDNYKDRNNLAKNLFRNCVSLESVIYTANPYEFTILSTTFDGCASLKEVTIGSNITTIADDAFINTGVLIINAPEGSTAAGITLPSLLERIEAFKTAGNEPANEGYCGVTQTVDGVLSSYDSNVKWEIFNLGTSAAPYYTIYFYIDSTSSNTASTVITSFANIAYADAGSAKDRYVSSNGYVSGGWASDYGSGKYHRWHSETIPATSISAIVIGENITKLTYNRGTFSGMTGVEVVECPKTFNEMQGAQFKGCSSLETLYTRGVNTPEIGTLNFGNFSTLPIGFTYDKANYGFAGLKSVKRYIFMSSYKAANITANPGSCVFYDNESLISITLPEGVTAVSTEMFANCTSLKEVTLPSTVTTVAAKSFSNCAVLEKVTFTDGNGVTIAADSTATAATGKPGATADLSTNAFRNCTALHTIMAPYGSDAWEFAYEHGFSSEHMYVSAVNHFGRYIIDPTTHHFSITDTGYSPSTTWRQYDEDEAALLAFLEPYRAEVLTASVAKFGKVVTQAGAKSIFEDMVNLTEVQFAANQRFASAGSLDNKEENQHGLFKGCSSLKTVWLGDISLKKENVIDLSKINIASPDQDNCANLLYYMFNGCSSIEEVILPELTSYYKSETLRKPRIWASTFVGCSLLEKLNIPEGMAIIDNGAFKDCTALEVVEFFAPASLITASTFTGTNNDLVLKVQSYETANTINGTLIGAGISQGSVRAFYKNGISIDGYQVRETSYNGLRTVFSINENAFAGYELVECGTLTATAAKWNNYSETFGEDNSVLIYDGTEYVTADTKIIKTPIYSGGEYVGNHIKTDNGAIFTVTVIKFADESQYKAELISCGYEIWKQGDEYFVYYTREEDVDYKTISLYKTTLGMLSGRAIELSVGNNPVYNTLMECQKEEFTPQEGIKGYFFVDPIDSSKKHALYITEGENEIILENIGFELSEKPNISGMIFGKNVKFDLPLIEDEYWQAELDAQLAKIPEGKSFIAFTDFHFELDGTRNTRKATELMKYVKTITGIKNIVNLGDTYTGEPTIAESKEIFDISVSEYFYDVFGTDGLYAVGNHESNITTWGGLKADGTDGKYAYEVLLPDTDIYNGTVANLYGKEGFVFDTSLTELAESGKISFSAVGPYSAEQMKEEYIAWAKLHYYYDDAENGIRYIVYNSGNCGLTEKYTFESNLWNSIYGTQYDFIANALMTTPAGYDIVLCGHMLGSSEYNDNGNTRDVSIFKLLSAFKSKKNDFSITLSSGYGNDNMAAVVGDHKKSYDFSETPFNGTIFTIGGHWHADFSCVYGTNSEGVYQSNLRYTEGDETADDAIFWIGLNNDCLEDPQSYEVPPTAVVTMTKGTDTENCFNVITITDEGDIVVTRFGAGDDRHFIYN